MDECSLVQCLLTTPLSVLGPPEGYSQGYSAVHLHHNAVIHGYGGDSWKYRGARCNRER